ncbi:biotin--[acetyl-CoA-carboxylase] ligase [Pengzhenrongella sp.]|jgi:BirA family biotin operon repressor/biotin-[acetyl-CoA-carboxylase] ligase|uniref:biotin--[acetyl-CoA-carboxylase] ligase n=1 Tax=Pengzhenrongella sp. TaxID=2888820 RepID=UPI002F9230D2
MSELVERSGLRGSVVRERLVSPAGPLSRVEVVPQVGSTNTDLSAALVAEPGAWGGLSLLAADQQDQGRGRSGRDWQVPPRAALILSISLWPEPAMLTSLGWLPLLAGLGAVRAVRATTGVQASLKWPNDLLVDADDANVLEGWGAQRKVGGILSELVTTPAGPAVVVGIGVNVSQTPDELPVPSAISLAIAGAPGVDREELLVAVVGAFAELHERWRAAGGDAVAAGLAAEVAAVCATIGLRVRVTLPGGVELLGLARRIGPDGALVVADDAGVEHTVLAGDVLHVRATNSP